MIGDVRVIDMMMNSWKINVIFELTLLGLGWINEQMKRSC